MICLVITRMLTCRHLCRVHVANSVVDHGSMIKFRSTDEVRGWDSRYFTRQTATQFRAVDVSPPVLVAKSRRTYMHRSESLRDAVLVSSNFMEQTSC